MLGGCCNGLFFICFSLWFCFHCQESAQKRCQALEISEVCKHHIVCIVKVKDLLGG